LFSLDASKRGKPAQNKGRRRVKIVQGLFLPRVGGLKVGRALRCAPRTPAGGKWLGSGNLHRRAAECAPYPQALRQLGNKDEIYRP